MKIFQTIALALFCSLLFTNPVFAIPGVPHQFYGSVTINGKPAPDGTLVIAKINGVEVARTYTKDGKYGYEPIFYVDDPNNDRSGSVITFFVNGIASKTVIFCNGCVTRLDISVQAKEEGGAPVTGGGGGGGLILPSEEENETQKNETVKETQACIERWLCTEWSECKNGIQTRECEDVNECGTEENKPLLVQPCSLKEENETEIKKEITQPSGVTGMFILIQNPAYLLILILAIIAVVLTIFRLKPLGKKK